MAQSGWHVKWTRIAPECWRRLLRDPWTARRSNPSILKEISSEYSLEGLMLRLKLQHFGRCWERLRARVEGVIEDEIVGWHHWLNGHEFEQPQGDSEGQESLVCYCPWDSLGENTEVDCYFHLQRIFSTQVSNPGGSPALLAGFLLSELQGRPGNLENPEQGYI